MYETEDCFQVAGASNGSFHVRNKKGFDQAFAHWLSLKGVRADKNSRILGSKVTDYPASVMFTEILVENSEYDILVNHHSYEQAYKNRQEYVITTNMDILKRLNLEHLGIWTKVGDGFLANRVQGTYIDLFEAARVYWFIRSRTNTVFRNWVWFKEISNFKERLINHV